MKNLLVATLPEKKVQLLLLQAAIELLYVCEAAHVESVWVEEQFHGTPIWEGDVEVFVITGHPKATHCYAWLRQDEFGRVRPVALLNKFPVHSPETAVRASIAFDASINTGHAKLPSPAPRPSCSTAPACS